jgi:hypothetical protein
LDAALSGERDQVHCRGRARAFAGGDDVHATLQRLPYVAQCRFRLSRIGIARFDDHLASGGRKTLKGGFRSTRTGVARQWLPSGRKVKQRRDVESVFAVDETVTSRRHTDDGQPNATFGLKP